MENEPIFDFSIDRGGTFTDVYCEYSLKNEKHTTILKLLSEDSHYKDAPREAIRRIISSHTKQSEISSSKVPAKNIRSIRMGTTIATNALLERKGTKTALLITKGFGDLLHIGTQNRQKIFDLQMRKPEKLFSKVIEVEERVRIVKSGEKPQPCKVFQGSSGDFFEVLQEINEEKLEKDLIELKNSGVSSLAIVFMFSYAFNEHELRAERIARKIGFSFVSVSHKVVPMFKIVPRGLTTIIDAYLNPHSKFYYK